MTVRDRAAEIIAAWNKDEVAIILNALSACDENDLDFLLSRLGHGGRDQYWRAVIAGLRPAFAVDGSIGCGGLK